MEQSGLVEGRPESVLRRMFDGHVPIDKSLKETIESMVVDEDIRNTIVLKQPKNKKKQKIVDLLNQLNDEEKREALIGMQPTVEKIEQYFC